MDKYESSKNKPSQVKSIIANKKKEALSLAVCAVLVIMVVVSIVEIILRRNAEDAQEKELRVLQEEYVSESGDDMAFPDELESESVDANTTNTADEPEDDPNAWYYDIDVDMAGLKEQNPDIIGWIYFEDEVGISYPLLYSGDDYYLTHNYLGEEETAGSIYIDRNNHSDLRDAHTLIHGHNMRNLSMFGKLKYYKTEEGYFENHRYFQLITEDAAYRYEVFAYKDVSMLTGGIYTTWQYVDDDFKAFVENTILAGSYIDSDLKLNDDMHIVTLSTCSYDSNVRFTVSAVRIDEHEWK